MSKSTDNRETTSSMPVAARLPDRAPPDQLSGLIKEYPGLVIAAGLGLGILASVLLPRSAGRKLLRGGAFLASAAGELGYAFGKQAVAKAGEGRERLGDLREELGERAGDAAQLAGAAGRKTAEAGRAAGDSVQRMAIDASSVVRELGEDLARRASKTLARLRD